MTRSETITSRDNRRLVRVREVRDGKNRSLVFLEGKRLVLEALKSGIEVDDCFISSNFQDEIVEKTLEELGIQSATVSEAVFRSIVDTNSPQGIVLLAKRPNWSFSDIDARLALAKLPIVLFLKEINNPSNLGAVLRTCEAVDVAGVIISKQSADAFSPKAVRASMGAVLRVPILQNLDLDATIDLFSGSGVLTTACDIGGSTNYTDLEWRSRRLLIFGSEAHGLEKNELNSINEKVLIPMENGVESLNLAVSTAIVLYEARRQNT